MKYLLILLGSCAALALTACDSNQHDADVNIGVVLPFTGTLGEAGVELRNGITLGIEDVLISGSLSNTSVSFIYEDNESTTVGSATAFNKMLKEHRVALIVGPVTSSATSHVLSAVDEAGVVTFSPTSSSTGLGAQSKWLFRLTLTIDRLVPYGIEVSKRHLGYRRVATIVNDGDTFSMSGHTKITEVLNADEDITIVAAESSTRPHGTVIGDLTAQLNAIQSANPDAIFLSGLPEDQHGIITQAHRLGITDTPFLSTLLAISVVKKINEEIPGAAENAVTFMIWLSSSDLGSSKAFVASYNARYGAIPGDLAARGYATIEVLKAVLSRAEDYQSSTLQHEFEHIKDHSTILGSLTFDEAGDAVYDPIVAQVKDNEFSVLE